MRVKSKVISGNLSVFREKERVKYKVYDKKGKVKVKIIFESGKSEDKLKNQENEL